MDGPLAWKTVKKSTLNVDFAPWSTWRPAKGGYNNKCDGASITIPLGASLSYATPLPPSERICGTALNFSYLRASDAAPCRSWRCDSTAPSDPEPGSPRVESMAHAWAGAC